LYSYEEVSINSVAKEINKLGLKPRKADSWSISSIKDILNNPVYIGKIRWNSRKQVIRSENGKRITSRPRNSDILLINGLH
ncbi:recombinase family protein, partial [Acinetobacter baumannii]|nr:recombinase family protein [Acinetobacter baumannii]